MKMFEYKIYDQQDGVNPDDEYGLNFLGKEGWELCAITKSHSEYGGLRFYFKRQTRVAGPTDSPDEE